MAEGDSRLTFVITTVHIHHLYLLSPRHPSYHVRSTKSSEVALSLFPPEKHAQHGVENSGDHDYHLLSVRSVDSPLA